jgi:hypothetical protein
MYPLLLLNPEIFERDFIAAWELSVQKPEYKRNSENENLIGGCAWAYELR